MSKELRRLKDWLEDYLYEQYISPKAFNDINTYVDNLIAEKEGEQEQRDVDK